MHVIITPDKKLMGFHMHHYHEMSRRSLPKTFATLPLNENTAAILNTGRNNNFIFFQLQLISLSATMRAGLGHDLAMPLTIFAEGAESELTRAGPTTSPALAGRAVLKITARLHSRCLTGLTWHQASEFNIFFQAPQGRQEGNLEIVSEIRTANTMKTHRNSMAAEKFIQLLPHKAFIAKFSWFRLGTVGLNRLP